MYVVWFVWETAELSTSVEGEFELVSYDTLLKSTLHLPIRLCIVPYHASHSG